MELLPVSMSFTSPVKLFQIKNFMELTAGSAFYCGLIADPYIHISGSDSVRL